MVILSPLVFPGQGFECSYFKNRFFSAEIHCTKRLLVKIRSSLLLTINYECTKHYNYLQAYSHKIQRYLQIQKLLKCQAYYY